MNRRLLLGAGLLVLLVASAGCTSIFGGGISDEQLDSNATYAWDEVPSWDDSGETPEPVETDETTDVYVNVTGGQYHAVYHLDNVSKKDFEVWTRGLSNENPVDISAVRYRYPNGTTVKGSELEVYKTNYKTHVVLPKSEGGTTNGTLAFTAPAEPKNFRLINYMEGSYEVALPKGMRTSFFLFGQVVPSADDRSIQDGRLHLEWEEVSGNITVKYYLERDFYLFTGAVGILGLVAIGGLAYYWYRIKSLAELREELGMNVDVSDDGDGPPPGMG
ncbi:DUF5803 family protein [Haloarchaeobius amylolyticus]|uniref:DUF5803 family protein n=1 Tax=Haloarchaeobius amylolyticus TaxID=1198296 RepID=UPI00226ED40A|nr:DUF5803 family protein [Haloarchaeobius amylolyticus]